ncbi:hypothetical protein Dimus_014137 [Dionaea muscipula]
MEPGTIAELNQTFRSGVTRSLEWRKAQLKALLKLLMEKETECFDALYHDLGKSNLEAYKDEIGPLKKSIDYALAHIKDWMAPKKAGTNLLFFPAKAKTIPEPFGLVLVISAWNLPISEFNSIRPSLALVARSLVEARLSALSSSQIALVASQIFLNPSSSSSSPKERLSLLSLVGRGRAVSLLLHRFYLLSSNNLVDSQLADSQWMIYDSKL